MFTSCGPHIQCWARGHLLHTIKGHLDAVHILYIFGKILVSISRDRCIKIWRLEGTATSPEVSVAPPSLCLA